MDARNWGVLGFGMDVIADACSRATERHFYYCRRFRLWRLGLLWPNDRAGRGLNSFSTPNLDQMAAEGMRFTDYYSGSTVCCPSRAVLLSGFHSGHSTIRGNSPTANIRAEDIIIPELLRCEGYETAVYGKYGMQQSPPSGPARPGKKGFDQFFGYSTHEEAHYNYPSFLWQNTPGGGVEQISIPVGTWSQDLFISKALDYIDQKKDQSFFLYMPFTIPHSNSTTGQMEGPIIAPYASKGWTQDEKKFASIVTLMDRQIGQILQKLKDLGIDDNTIVFFTSDNGPTTNAGHSVTFFDSNGVLKGEKRDLYDGGIRVPMIARWPGKIAPGTVSGQVWAAWDVLPTISDITYCQTPVGIDGISMKNALLSQSQTSHPYLYWEFEEGASHPYTQAVRMGQWKGWKRGATFELYNLNNDPGEANNIAAGNPSVVTRIKQKMISAHVEGAPPVSSAIVNIKGDVTGFGTSFTLDFGNATLGSAPITRMFSVKNLGTNYVHMMEGSVTGAGITDTRLAFETGPYTALTAQSTSDVYQVTFTPSRLGTLLNQTAVAKGFWSYDGTTPELRNPVTLSVTGKVIP